MCAPFEFVVYILNDSHIIWTSLLYYFHKLLRFDSPPKVLVALLPVSFPSWQTASKCPRCSPVLFALWDPQARSEIRCQNNFCLFRLSCVINFYTERRSPTAWLTPWVNWGEFYTFFLAKAQFYTLCFALAWVFGFNVIDYLYSLAFLCYFANSRFLLPIEWAKEKCFT